MAEAKAKEPSLLLALLPLIAMTVFIGIGVAVLKVDPHVPIVLGTCVAAAVGKYLGFSWEYMEQAMIQSISSVIQACLILMIVGGLIGIWVAGGVVPGMIYYGLQLLTRESFLVVTVILCSIVAISTGSAWSTVGTFGVAAMGIGLSLEIPAPVVAGAILSGSLFGDKMCPLSDTANLASGVAGSNLFDHIRHMVFTTVPSYILTLIIFFIMGLGYGGQEIDTQQIHTVTSLLSQEFTINPLIFIPPAFVLLMVMLKVPAIPGLMVCCFLGVFFCFYQGQGAADCLTTIYYGFSADTGNDFVNELLSRGGIESMLYSIAIVIFAMCFGGVLEKTNCLPVIIGNVLKLLKTRGSIVTSNLVACVMFNFLASDQYMAIAIPGNMYKPVYKKLNLHPKNLSRVLEDAGTLTSGLCPWNSCGSFYFATLGVSAFAYAPFCFLLWLNPIISSIYAFTGFSMTPLDPSKPTNRIVETTISEAETAVAST